MKYFLEDLSDEQWKYNMERYWAAFEKIKKKLPSNIAEILSSKFLHDSEILAFVFQKESEGNKFRYDLQIKIKNEEFEGSIVHRDVVDYQNTYNNPLKDRFLCEYLYGEVYYEQGLWIHNVRYTLESELMIRCKKIEWVSA